MINKELTFMEETDRMFRKVWKKYQYYLMPIKSDLSMHQMLFLKYLYGKETCTPSDIAQQFGITLGAVTGFVDRLYKLGLINRTRSEEDRRVVLIQLSPNGIEALNTFEKEKELKFAFIFEKIGGSQMAELKKALEQLNVVLDDLALAKEE